MKYNVTLVAGCRYNGAPRFGSTAERLQGELDWIELTSAFKSRITNMHEQLGSFTLELTLSEAAQLLTDKRVLSVDPVVSFKAFVITQVGAPWHLSRICGQQDADTYDYVTTGLGTKVLIFDTGMDTTHAEFENRAIQVYDAFNGVALDSNHGTHVAGIIGGKTFGVAKECQLISLRVIIDAGGTDTDVIGGINWVLDNIQSEDRMVANFSLGSEADGYSTLLENAILAMITDGVIVVVAAGNDSADVSSYSPARMLQTITVGATDLYDKLADFSNYGVGVTIQAPGVDVMSCIPNNLYATMSGTSMASPVVAGIAARFLELQPSADQTAFKIALMDAAFKSVAVHQRADTTHDVVSSKLHARITGAGTIPLLGLNPFKQYIIRPYALMSDNSKVYGDEIRTNVAPGPALLVSYGSHEQVQVASVSRAIALTTGNIPLVSTNEISTVRLVPLTLDPDTTVDYSLNFSKASGTFQFGTVAKPPIVQSDLDIQGFTGTVERVSTNVSRSGGLFTVQGRLLPLFINDMISIDLIPKLDHSSYTLEYLVGLIADQAGTEVLVALAGLLYERYQFSGRFVDALSTLANDAGGELVQQNGSWFIIPLYQPLGSFTIPVDDVISASVEDQTDVRTTITSLVQARKSITDAQIQNANQHQTLVYQLQKAVDELITQGSLGVAPTGSQTGVPVSAAGTTNYPGGSLEIGGMFGVSSSSSTTITSTATIESGDTTEAQTVVVAKTSSLAVKSTVSLPPLKLAFGVGTSDAQLNPTVLVEAAPWSWETWPEDSPRTTSSYSTEYYQVIAADPDSFGKHQKKGLLTMDMFTNILLELSLPSPGGILRGQGKLVNLDIDQWAGNADTPGIIPIVTRQYRQELGGGRFRYVWKYFVQLTGTVPFSNPGGMGTGGLDNRLYTADLALSYETYNPVPFQIDGILTLDHYMLNSSDNKCIGFVESQVLYGFQKDIYGTYNAASKTFSDSGGNVVGLIDDSGNIKSLSGGTAGTLSQAYVVDAPVFNGTAVIEGQAVKNSVGDVIGSVQTNLKTIQSLGIRNVTVIYSKATGDIIAWVDSDNNLVIKASDKVIGPVDTVIANIGGYYCVAGGTGAAAFGMPAGYILGLKGILPIQYVTDNTVAYVQSNVISKNLGGEPIAFLDANGNITSTAGALGSISGGIITITNPAGLTILGLTGTVGEKCGYITDRPAGLYNTINKFVCSIVGSIVRSPGGTVLGSVVFSGLVRDNQGNLFGTVDSSGVLRPMHGPGLGVITESASGSNYGYISTGFGRNSNIIGRYKSSAKYFIPRPGDKGPSDNVNDTWAPYVDDNAFVPSNFYQSNTNPTQQLADSAQEIEDQLQFNLADAARLSANLETIDASLKTAKAESIISLLNQLQDLKIKLNALTNPIYDPERPTPIFTYKETIEKQKDEDALESQIMAQDKEISTAITDLPIALEVFTVSFIYNGVLPLPGNSIVLSNEVGNLPTSFGQLDSASFNNAVVSVTAKRYVSTQ
jgi:hypothetical protein